MGSYPDTKLELMVIFISLVFLTLSLASNISPAPIAIATTVRAPAKTRKRRSIRVRLFHQGTWRDKKLLRQNHLTLINLYFANLCHVKESETMEQKEKETITLRRDLSSTMLAQKGPRHIRLAREIIF